MVVQFSACSVRWAFKCCPGRNCRSSPLTRVTRYIIDHWSTDQAVGLQSVPAEQFPSGVHAAWKYFWSVSNNIVQHVLAKLHTNRRFWQWGLGLPGCKWDLGCNFKDSLEFIIGLWTLRIWGWALKGLLESQPNYEPGILQCYIMKDLKLTLQF